MAKRINLYKKNTPKKDTIEVYEKKLFGFLKQYNIYLLAIVLCVSIIPASYFFIKSQKKNNNNKAAKEIFQAVYYFEDKEYDKALAGGDSYKGFNEIIKEYPNTKIAQLANFYVGVIHMHKKEYKLAINHLKKFKTNDFLFKARSLSLIGDAYSQLENYKDAIKFYLKASKEKPNKIYSPKYLSKAANLYIKLNEKKEAVKCYKKIKKLYSGSVHANDVQKKIYTLNQ